MKTAGTHQKNLLVQELAIALAKQDIKSILGRVSDDVQWHIVGKTRVQGKSDLVASIPRHIARNLTTITIDHVVTHGKAGCVNGTLETKRGVTTSFCDVFEFTSAKGESVTAITSYLIDGEP